MIPKIMRMRLAAALAISLFGACALAQAPPGDIRILLIAPKGFSQVAPKHAELARLGQKFTPESNRLLGHFVSEADLKKKGREVVFGRYLLAQVARSNDAKPMSASTFAQVRKLMRTQQADLLRKLEPPLAQLAPKIEQAKGNQLEPLRNLKAGVFVPVGVFHDTDHAVAVGTLSRLQYNEDGHSAEHLMVTATVVTLLRERPVFLYAYAAFRGPEDLRWAKSAALAWAEDLRTINK